MIASRVVVIGDSHSSFFTGVDRIAPPYPAGPTRWGPYDVFHVGPGLASSLVERDSTNATRTKALDVLARFRPDECLAVILCFGEIDCRFHIRRRLETAKLEHDEALARSVQVSAHRYMSFVLEVSMMGFRPVVFGPVATSAASFDPPYEWPTLGTMEERNDLSRRFDGLMQQLCREVDVCSVSLLPHLIDARLRTRTEYYFDGVHLGQAAWPLFTLEARRAMPEIAAALSMEAADIGR